MSNITILERVRALWHANGLPKSLWGEAARHVMYLMNRSSTRAIEERARENRWLGLERAGLLAKYANSLNHGGKKHLF